MSFLKYNTTYINYQTELQLKSISKISLMVFCKLPRSLYLDLMLKN